MKERPHILLEQIFIGFCVCLSLTSYAQEKQLKFDHLGVRNGLSDDAVTCITQDSKGFIWFGTYNGLSKFDGYDITVMRYDEGDTSSLHDNTISCIMEDHAGKLWVGSLSNGVSIYDPVEDSFSAIRLSEADTTKIRSLSVNVLYEDSSNNVWIGTENGLVCISPDRKTRKEYHYSPKHNKQTINGRIVYDIVEDKIGQIWIATEARNLSVYNPKHGRFSEVAYTDLPLSTIDDNIFKNFYLQQDSLLWIGSNNGGLSRLDIRTLEYHTYLPDRLNNSITSYQVRDIIQVDESLWLALDGGGLDVFDLQTQQFSNYQNSRSSVSSLSTNSLWSMCLDRQGIVWIGTYQGGVNRYDPRNNYFTLLNRETQTIDLPDYPILSLFEDSGGDIWVGTDWGGLHRINPDKTIDHYVHDENDNSLSIDVVKSIHQDRLGNLLIGTYKFGLTSFNETTGQFKHYKSDPKNPLSIPNHNVWGLLTDSQGLTWVAMLGGGIAIFDPVQETFVQPAIDYKNGGQHHVYHIYEDSQSNLWFSTDGGVICYERRTEKWSSPVISEWFGTSNQEVDHVKAIVEDDHRDIWMATAAGLLRYRQAKDEFTLFGKESGLAELPLVNLKTDDYGNLILVSRTYITQFDMAKETMTSYQVKDNSLTYNSMITRADGRIWAGGIRGISVFDPKDLRKNEFVPPVYLTELRISNEIQSPTTQNTVLTEAIWDTERIDLPYDQSVINFQYTALNFTETERNNFAYRLQGFDQDWNIVGQRRMATYTNLDPGTYTFQVKASNNHDVWNEFGTQVVIVVHPPYWQTWWFRTIVILLAFYLIFWVIRTREIQLKRKLAYQKLSNEREVMDLKNESLKKKLSTTKDELAHITMSYLHKNQKLQKIRKRVSEASAVMDADQRLMNKIVREIDHEIQDHEYWDKFEHQFNKSHDNFLKRFKQKYPDLSKRELRICAYLRMGMDNHEISILMNVTLRTIETSRYRIRKKIMIGDRRSLTKMILRF